jgi:hypothetical protein
MAIARRKPDPDGITTAELAGTAGRYVGQNRSTSTPRWPSCGRSHTAAATCSPNRLILGFRVRDEADDEWPRKAPEAALVIAAGADLTRLTGWIVEGQRRAERVRSTRGGTSEIPASGGGRTHPREDPAGSPPPSSGEFRRRRVSRWIARDAARVTDAWRWSGRHGCRDGLSQVLRRAGYDENGGHQLAVSGGPAAQAISR